MNQSLEFREDVKLHHPWMIAVWPGMGHVAINAGFYLAAKLDMRVFAEFSPRELFDIEHVDVEQGVIRPARLPRSRLFVWRDPAEKRDLVLFIGEAQPPAGKRSFCRSLTEFAQTLGIERIFTFASMATQMHPQHHSRVFVAATDQPTLSELLDQPVEVLEEGHIGGLNGVLLGEAAAAGLHGACLLGEIPHIFSQLPFPGGSVAVLKVFSGLTGIPLDLAEMQEQAHEFGEKLGEVLAKVEEAQQEAGEDESDEEEESEITAPEPEAEPEPKLSPSDEQRVEALFAEADKDRSKAYVLKQLLDRLDVFADYEDRFLDLFKKGE
ncbi:PAC2 family protein [Planctellipticum variicoloris]|uniref:PAC2 family protein n=1 Tax=Planctellipticum variicoloris TaxID=3064265 RepID=UPI003013BC83|nr:PAC2 family protein [Planctomycetaceae bacterium SH412]